MINKAEVLPFECVEPGLLPGQLRPRVPFEGRGEGEGHLAEGGCGWSMGAPTWSSIRGQCCTCRERGLRRVGKGVPIR